ncbi:MAG: hypothetical protein ACYDCL_21110 [Myxococcales bacterium]
MRSLVEFALVAALAACGNYSDLDIPFYEALPAASQLHVAVPSAAGQAVCSTATSDALSNAQSVGGSLNTGLEDILGLVDLIKSLPPSKRGAGTRQWGPWSDTPHPGFDIQVSMVEADGGFGYELDEGPSASKVFTPLLTGSFSGGEAATGAGTLSLDFATAWSLGIAKPTDPHGPLVVDYDLGSDPETIDLTLTQAGLSLQAFRYQYALWRDGHGRFVFQFQDPAGDVVLSTVDFLGDGSGEATTTGTLASGATATVAECWDASACLSYLNDPQNFTKQPGCAAGSPCDFGDAGACPPIPDGGI